MYLWALSVSRFPRIESRTSRRKTYKRVKTIVFRCPRYGTSRLLRTYTNAVIFAMNFQPSSTLRRCAKAVRDTLFTFKESGLVMTERLVLCHTIDKTTLRRGRCIFLFLTRRPKKSHRIIAYPHLTWLISSRTSTR